MLVVLMITMVFGLIVVALLSTTMSSIMIGSSISEQAAQQQAADAAIETWIGQLKTSTSATGSCNDVTIPGAQPVTVTVTCSSTSPPAPSGPLGRTSMLLLGGYTYVWRDLAYAKEFLNGWLSRFLGTLADWTNQNGPGFLHYGPEPLIVDTGDIVVRQQGLVWHEKPEGGGHTPVPGPAVELRDGKYVQRPASWLFGNFFGSPPCGMLDPAFDTTWSETLIGTLPDKGFHIGATQALSCGQEPSSSAIFDDPGWAPPATFTPAVIRSGKGLSGGCDALKLTGTNVVALSPGAYNRLDTAVLNRWFGPGDCDNATFWFKPGDYYFDAAGLVRGDLFSRSAIVFDDPTSNVVFGSAVGWTPGTSDRAPPGARTCALNGADRGVTITLSTRTTFLHKAGWVSACSDWVGGVQRTLVHQLRPGASERWIGKPTNGAGGFTNSVGFLNPVNATGSATSPDTTESPTAKSASCNTCGSPSITLLGFVDLGSPAPYGATQSATLKIRGGVSGTWGPGLDSTLVNIVSADGSKWCVAREGNIGVDVDLTGVNAYEAFQSEPKCGEVFREAIDYEGAKITATFNPSQKCLLWWCEPYSVSLDYAWLDISTSNAEPGGTFETRVDPQNGSQLTLFGPVYMPRGQVAVRWMGSDPAAQFDPIFTGGLVAQALLSGVDYEMTPNGKPGQLAGLNRVDGWTTSLRATVDGKLRATAVVRIDNAAYRPVTIKEWRVCNAPATATDCPLPD